MEFIRRMVRPFLALFRRERLDTEMSEEMRLHLELQTAEHVKRGMNPDEARYAAQRNFGNVGLLQERVRDQRGWRWLDSLRCDVRFSWRSLRRSPVFSVTAVGTLALCIGANTAILAALHSLVLKRLPFHEPDQLVEIYTTLPMAGVFKTPTSVVQYLDYKANADRFDGFALWAPWSFTVVDQAVPARGSGVRVTPDIFPLLGLQPLLGRFYSMDDCAPGRDRVVVLTQTYWETRYASDPAIVGTTIRIDGESYTILGVAPRTFEAINRDVMVLKPFECSLGQTKAEMRHQWSASMFARVKASVSLPAAEAQLAVLEGRYFEEIASQEERRALRDEAGLRVAIGRIRVEQAKPVANGLLLLQAGAFVVLLLGALNLATLMLVRVGARQPEFAIRHALGAGSRALTSQLLTESLLVAACGSLIGIGVGWSSLRVFNTSQAWTLAAAPVVTLEPWVLAVMIALSLGVALLMGLGASIRFWKSETLCLRRDRSHSGSGDGRLRNISGALVVAQVALAFILLVSAGLLIRSYARVIAVDSGFDALGFVHARIALSPTHGGGANAAARDRILAALRSIPGVEAASVMPGDPIKGEYAPAMLPIDGSSASGAQKAPTAWLLNVTPDFFDTMGIRFIEGRAFTASEVQVNAGPRAVVVDRTFAERHFPGRSPIGQKLGHASPGPGGVPVIVGVAETTRFSRRDVREERPFVYMASSYAPRIFSVILRTKRPVTDLVSELRETLRHIDSTVPVYDVQTMDVALDGLLAARRGVMGLLGAFAAIAILLAAIGIYGLLAYDVVQRTREIGIRAALGATQRQLIWLILGQGLRRAIFGVAIGFVGAGVATHFLRSQLFGVGPNDPMAFTAALLLVLGIATIASWWPARGATKVDPLVALRGE